MSNTEKRKTGKILPRNYGLRLSMPREAGDVFVAPTAYALAQVMLETPQEIKTRIQDWVQFRGEGNRRKIEGELRDAVMQKEGSLNVLNLSRRVSEHQDPEKLILTNMKHHGAVFTGSVRSKEEGKYAFSLREPPKFRAINISYPGSRVETLDSLYNEGKGRDIVVIGAHQAIPEIALYLDAHSRISQRSNITGLLPSEREMNSKLPELPFTFNFFKTPDKMNKGELEKYRTVTEILLDYYIEGKSQYELNKKALQNPRILSPELVKSINYHTDPAQFKVLRQREEEISKSKLTSDEDRRYAATTNMIKKIGAYLERNRQCYPAGYSREFIGTPWETVARRFESKGRGPVYSLVTSDEHPPLIVARLLGEKSLMWSKSYDPVQKGHVSEKIGLKYSQLDDVTRRDSQVQLILPDKNLRNVGFSIPFNLQREYDELRSKIGKNFIN